MLSDVVASGVIKFLVIFQYVTYMQNKPVNLSSISIDVTDKKCVLLHTFD